MPNAEVQTWQHARFASFVALFTSILTIITFGIAIFTPPLGGPWCTESCFAYPFTDIASRFPRDYLWMYPAMVQLMAYVAFLACIHEYASSRKKLFSLLGLCAGLSAAAILFADYFVQVSVIQPGLLNGETDGIAILTQFNAHGVFIVLEEAGYLLMSIAFLCLAPVFSGGNMLERAIRWLFVSACALTVVSLLGISAAYGIQREYRFEIAAISINWLVLIVTGFLASALFVRSRMHAIENEGD